MRKFLLAMALTAAGLTLSGCWHDHAHGWGDHGPNHGDHGHDHDHGGYSH